MSVSKLRNFPPLCVREKKTEFILGSAWGRHFLFTSFQLAHPDALLTLFISPTKEAGRLKPLFLVFLAPTHVCLFVFLLFLYLPDDVKDGGYEQFVVDGRGHITRLVESRGHGADSVAEVHPPQQEKGLRWRTRDRNVFKTSAPAGLSTHRHELLKAKLWFCCRFSDSSRGHVLTTTRCEDDLKSFLSCWFSTCDTAPPGHRVLTYISAL